MMLIVVLSTMMIMTHPICVTFRHRFSCHLVFFFLAHSMNLLFQKLHLISVAVPDLILLPLFVFPALLHFPSVNVETIQVLHHLQLVVEVQLAVLLASALMRHRYVIETRAVKEKLVLVAQSMHATRWFVGRRFLLFNYYAALSRASFALFVFVSRTRFCVLCLRLGLLVCCVIVLAVVVESLNLKLQVFQASLSLGFLGGSSFLLLYVFRVLLHELGGEVQQRLVFVDHVRVLGLRDHLTGVRVLLGVVEGLTGDLEMFHEELVVLRALSNCFSWGAGLYSMVLRGTTFVRDVSVETLRSRVTARVFSGVLLKVEIYLAWVVAAVIYFGSKELFVAMCATELLKACEHFPENVLP